MRFKIALACLSTVAVLASPSAGAQTVYTENFNNTAFQAGSLLPNNYSDRWANTNYYYINNADGWTFTGGAYLATNGDDPSDSALLLNENGYTTASITLSGLTIGAGYVVNFLQWGDNEPGSPYGGTLSAGGTSILSYTGVDQAPGTNPGVERTAFFVADGTSETLVFGQDTPDGSGASPIIDDISVTDVPEPMSLALLGTGLFGLGLLRHRKTA